MCTHPYKLAQTSCSEHRTSPQSRHHPSCVCGRPWARRGRGSCYSTRGGTMAKAKTSRAEDSRQTGAQSVRQLSEASTSDILSHLPPPWPAHTVRTEPQGPQHSPDLTLATKRFRVPSPSAWFHAQIPCHDVGRDNVVLHLLSCKVRILHRFTFSYGHSKCATGRTAPSSW